MKNPQAFPKLNAEEQCSGEFLAIQEKGMTLLDYFAGKILSATISNDRFLNKLIHESKDSDLGRERYLAEHCYIYAEAMLEERERIND